MVHTERTIAIRDLQYFKNISSYFQKWSKNEELGEAKAVILKQYKHKQVSRLIPYIVLAFCHGEKHGENAIKQKVL